MQEYLVVGDKNLLVGDLYTCQSDQRSDIQIQTSKGYGLQEQAKYPVWLKCRHAVA